MNVVREHLRIPNVGEDLRDIAELRIAGRVCLSQSRAQEAQTSAQLLHTLAQVMYAGLGLLCGAIDRHARLVELIRCNAAQPFFQ